MDDTTRAFPTPIEVLSVNDANDTASVIIVGWHITRPVDIPLQPIVDATGMTPEVLPGTWLEAHVNCYAASPADLVVKGITLAPPLPDGWLDAPL